MKLFNGNPSSKKILFIAVLLSGFAASHIACNKTMDYPRKPDRLGSGKVKWTESLTPDGWTMVTNEGGATLGYSKSSGLKLIQSDGYAFKDLNRNNLLDQFEDWRVDYETRAASIVKEIPVDQMMGMKMNPFGIGSVNADALDDDIRNRLEIGYRQLRAPGSNTSGSKGFVEQHGTGVHRNPRQYRLYSCGLDS
jgi:beta-glucosidase